MPNESKTPRPVAQPPDWKPEQEGDYICQIVNVGRGVFRAQYGGGDTPYFQLKYLILEGDHAGRTFLSQPYRFNTKGIPWIKWLCNTLAHAAEPPNSSAEVVKILQRTETEKPGVTVSVSFYTDRKGDRRLSDRVDACHAAPYDAKRTDAELVKVVKDEAPDHFTVRIVCQMPSGDMRESYIFDSRHPRSTALTSVLLKAAFGERVQGQEAPEALLEQWGHRSGPVMIGIETREREGHKRIHFIEPTGKAA